jgi:hypothetical protein
MVMMFRTFFLSGLKEGEREREKGRKRARLGGLKD